MSGFGLGMVVDKTGELVAPRLRSAKSVGTVNGMLGPPASLLMTWGPLVAQRGHVVGHHAERRGGDPRHGGQL